VDDARRRLGLVPERLAGAERAGLPEALSALAAGVLLVIDHGLGGGSSGYRDGLLTAAAGRGQPSLLLQFQEAGAAYLWTLRAGGRTTRFVSKDLDWLPTLLAPGSVDAVVLNNCVSYPNPLDLIATLALSARHHRVPVTLPVHDYFCICPSFPLLDDTGRHCAVPPLSACETCMARNALPYMKRIPRTAVTPWRLVWGELLAQGTVVTFCRDSERLLRRAYPDLAPARLRLEPHAPMPFPEPARDESPRRRPWSDSGIEVAVVGHIAYLKGAEMVAGLVALADARRLPLRVTVIGTLEHPIRSRRLRVTGAYRRDALPVLLARQRPHCVLLPSIWPETYSLVTAELTMLGLPIVAFDLGAPAERLRDDPNAVLVSPVSAEALLDAILTRFVTPAAPRR
jgi:glycosyltransferase involved in cell wall biosynthesis